MAVDLAFPSTSDLVRRVPHSRNMTDTTATQTLTPGAGAARGWTHEAPSAVIDWYTPEYVFEALDTVFDLDPCSPGTTKSNVPARAVLTLEDDGLTSAWNGMCWVNPPYDDTRTWLRRLATHGNGIALVFARTDTKWFHEAAASADLVCFTSGRIRFIDGRTMKRGGSPGAGSVFLAWGEAAADALRRSGLGLCFTFEKNVGTN